MTALPPIGTERDPPVPKPVGIRSVSPVITLIRSNGIPKASAATVPKMVS